MKIAWCVRIIRQNPRQLSMPLGGGGRWRERDDGNITAFLKDRVFDVLHLLQSMKHPRSFQDIFFRHLGFSHSLQQRFSFVDDYQRQALRDFAKKWKIFLQQREDQVRCDQRNDENEGTRQRIVLSDKRLLRHFADDKQQHKIKRSGLREASLAYDPEPEQNKKVDGQTSDDGIHSLRKNVMTQGKIRLIDP